MKPHPLFLYIGVLFVSIHQNKKQWLLPGGSCLGSWSFLAAKLTNPAVCYRSFPWCISVWSELGVISHNLERNGQWKIEVRAVIRTTILMKVSIKVHNFRVRFDLAIPLPSQLLTKSQTHPNLTKQCYAYCSVSWKEQRRNKWSMNPYPHPSTKPSQSWLARTCCLPSSWKCFHQVGIFVNYLLKSCSNS